MDPAVAMNSLNLPTAIFPSFQTPLSGNSNVILSPLRSGLPEQSLYVSKFLITRGNVVLFPEKTRGIIVDEE